MMKSLTHRFILKSSQEIPAFLQDHVVEIVVIRWDNIPNHEFQQVEEWATSSIVLEYVSGQCTEDDLRREQIMVRLLDPSGRVLLDTITTKT